jgi:hypothetical protein
MWSASGAIPSHQVGATGSGKLHLWQGRRSQHAGSELICDFVSLKCRSSSIPPPGLAWEPVAQTVAPYWLLAMMHVGRCSTLTETPSHSVRKLNFIILRTMAARRTDRVTPPLMLAHMKLASTLNINNNHGFLTLGSY